MIGNHFIKGWSRTQNNITTSSAEAELIALVKGSAELLGVRSMLVDLGCETSGVIYADSSAALAIAKRKGAGKLRHINVSSLWVQERQDKENAYAECKRALEQQYTLVRTHARQARDHGSTEELPARTLRELDAS